MSSYKVKPQRSYFSMVPHILFDYELSNSAFKLYVYYLRVGGENSSCWQSSKTITANTGLSRPTITKGRQDLIDKGLIEVEEHDSGTHQVTIVDIMAQNVEKFTGGKDSYGSGGNNLTGHVKESFPKEELFNKTPNKEERTHATIDDLNPNYRHNQTLTKTPLSNLEGWILHEIATALNTKPDTIKEKLFFKENGKTPNLDKFAAFCKVVDRHTFKERLTSMLDNWSTTSWGKKNNPPTLGRVMAEWDKWDGNAINEFAMIQELLKVWDKGNGLDKAREMVNGKPYEDIKRKMGTVDFNRGIGFKGLSKFSVDDWSKLK